MSGQTYHREAVSNPHVLPAPGTLWYDDRLTVYGHHLTGHLTHGTPTDVRHDPGAVDGVHHGSHWFRGRQPVTVVITRRQGTTVVQVTEHEWHDVKTSQTTTRFT